MARTNQMIPVSGNRALLALALVAGLVAAILVFAALSSSDGGGGSSPAPDSVKAVVASKNIPAGTEITSEMVKVVSVPASVHVDGAFDRVGPVTGETARYPIEAGEQVTRAKVGPQTENDGLAFVVPKGMRAVSVEVDEMKGVGGLLRPGDRVDVIAVFTETRSGGELTEVTTALQNIEVLAVAQKAQSPVPPLSDAEDSSQQETTETATSGKPPEEVDPQPNARTVTLAVTAQQVQLLAFIQEEGVLYLSLRPFGEDTAEEIPSLIVPPPPPED